MDSVTFVLNSDGGGGYWPGLIVPAVIVIVGLLTAAVVLLVSRERPTAGPEPGITPEPGSDDHAEEPHEDE